MLSDSSDDERHDAVSRYISSRAPQPQARQSQVICLLDSDNEDEKSSTTKIPSSEALLSRKQGQSKLRNSYMSTKYPSLDSDSDDDSLDQYKPSGLSRGARKRKRNTSALNPDESMQLFSPHASGTINKVTPVQPSNGTASTSRVISQEMDQTQTSPSENDFTSSSTDAARLAQHSIMEPRRIMANPYAKKKQKSPPATASTSTGHTPDPSRMISNPYARKSPPINIPSEASTLDPLPSADALFPTRLTKRGTTYPDLRAKLALCLWRYARSLTHSSYHRAKFAQTIQKAVAVSCMAEHPIRSLQEYILRFQAQSIEAVSVMNQKVNDLTEQLTKGGWETVSTTVDASATCQYYSIAEACLVVCKKRLHAILQKADNLEEELKKKEHYIPLSVILPDIDRHLRPECPANITRPQDEDNGVKFYEQSSTISAEYHQIKRLCSLSYIKFHKSKGRILVELLPTGYRIAERLVSRVYPAPNGWYRRSHKDYSTAPACPAAVSTVNAAPSSWSSNIVLCMDFREGGGGTRVLHQMCNDLDSIQLPYFVASLSIGDYVFFHKDKLLPVLIERKSVEDLAQSIYDGRWQSQKKRMYQGQYIFGYEKAILIYIVEGKQEHHLVTGGFIGNTRFKISLERLNDEIAKLSQDGFEVLRTASPSGTLNELSKWAKKIDQQVQDKVLVPKYTYEEFKQQVSKIPSTVDFSRIAKDHYQQRKERELQQEAVITLDSDDDDDMIVSTNEASAHPSRTSTPVVAPGTSGAAAIAKGRQLQETIITMDSDDDDDATDRIISTSKNSSLPVPTSRSVAAPRISGAAAIAMEIKRRTSGAFPKAEHPDYSKWKRDELVKECLQFGLTKSGSRNDLIERLQGPRPPTLWIERKTKGHWVPARPDSSGTALMVALLLLHQEFPSETEGFRKADICKKADALNISREPFVGGKKSFGQFYDGWSSCAYCKKDPALVEKGKNFKFRLTKQGQYAGYPLAEQLHEWCHLHNTCSCKDI